MEQSLQSGNEGILTPDEQVDQPPLLPTLCQHREVTANRGSWRVGHTVPRSLHLAWWKGRQSAETPQSRENHPKYLTKRNTTACHEACLWVRHSTILPYHAVSETGMQDVLQRVLPAATSVTPKEENVLVEGEEDGEGVSESLSQSNGETPENRDVG